MFGGLCFLLNGKLLVGVFKDSLLVRLGPDGAKSAMTKPHVREMDFSSRPMKPTVRSYFRGVRGIRTRRFRTSRAGDPRVPGGAFAPPSGATTAHESARSPQRR